MFGCKILIVDDEPATRKLIGRYPIGADYDCAFAETVDSAQKILAASAPENDSSVPNQKRGGL